MACTQTTNPAQITVESGITIHIVCVAHAAFYQQVILSWNQDMSNPIGTFSGTGEGVGMTLANGNQLLSTLTGSNSTLFAQFNFSTAGSQGPFQKASVCAPTILGGGLVTQVTSEDYLDSDDNDSYLTIMDLTSSSAESLDANKQVQGAKG